jgi:tetratricopeptide (TPR) repeat protein
MIPILAAIFTLALVVVIFTLLMGRKRDGSAGKPRSKNKEARLREANKRLTLNPLDPEALNMMGDIYYEESAWDKAEKTYETLAEIITREPVPGIDKFEVFYRFATSASKLNLSEQAYRAFGMARTIKQDNFEVNYNLGALEFERKNYEKALQLLQTAHAQNPDNPAVLRCMGHSFFRLKKPKEAMSFIRKAIELAPDDKESLYTLAECYYEANQIDQALKIFSHLRADPLMGPSACLISGNIHNEVRRADLAIQDFEMGLKHENIRPDILAELRYYLAVSYIKINEISKALPLLLLLQEDNP